MSDSKPDGDGNELPELPECPDCNRLIQVPSDHETFCPSKGEVAR